MSETMLAMLREEYLAAQEEKKRKRREIQERHREAINQDVAVMEDAVDKRLGEMLVRSLGSGMKRMDIWKPVFGTNDNKRWSRLVELGGGETRTKRTGAEIVTDAVNARESAKQAIYAQHGATGDYVNEKGHLVVTFESGLHAYLHTYPDGSKQLLPTNGTDEHWQRFIRTQPEARTAIMNLLKEQN